MAVSGVHLCDVEATDTTFWSEVVCELLSCSQNFFPDNVDRLRFPGRVPLVHSIRDRLLQLASKRMSPRLSIDLSRVAELLSVNGLPQTYGALEDRDSRDLFVKLLVYRILGPRRVKLPINSAPYWKKVDQAKQCLVKQKVVQDVPIIGTLDLYAINDLQLIGSCLTVVNTFLLEQYRCDRAGVRVQPGDVVIDAGGCWGDTALYFAQNATQVFCFECIPSNIAITQDNLALNPGLAAKIRVIQKALWSRSGEKFVFTDSGPGSRLASGELGVDVQTQTLDDFASTNSLERVDFIKMDIEGSEPEALIGAERTIRTFLPQLAISIYHDLGHFASIPNWIASLDLGYRFYLDHFTIHEEETILFARSDSPSLSDSSDRRNVRRAND